MAWACALALMLAVCAAPAMAAKAIDLMQVEVMATGDVNMRGEPNLNGELMGTLKTGKSLSFMEETSTDDRGVVWYLATDGELIGWVSSRYSELTDGVFSGYVYEDEGVASMLAISDSVLHVYPDGASDYLTTIAQGSTVSYLRYFINTETGTWFYVMNQGEAGWVLANDFEPVAQAQE